MKLGVKLVLASLFRLVTLEKDNAATFIASGEVVTGLVEFDGGYDIGLGDVLNISLVTEAPTSA